MGTSINRADPGVAAPTAPRVMTVEMLSSPAFSTFAQQLSASIRRGEPQWTDGCSFAHPAECDLAEILSFYGVRWVYEPTTFRLELNAQGLPSQQVTPDFYLPDHDLYIELTTMRQALVTRKNRKIRKLREVFPSIQVKLLYRRDYDRLVGSHGDPGNGLTRYELGETILSPEQIARRTSELAADLIESERSRMRFDPRQEILLLGLGRGSRRFLNLLGDQLLSQGQDASADWISLTRREQKMGQQRVRVGRRPELELAGRRVILVSDIISSGLSVSFVKRWLTRQGVGEITTCTLLDRPDARILDVPVGFAGFEAPNELLAGFGIPIGGSFAESSAIRIVTSS